MLSAWKDGLSQQERLEAAPDPANVEIDGRGMTDFLKLAADLSAQFNFYDFNNEIEGDWSAFFAADITTLAAIISRIDITDYSRQYEKHRSLLYYAETTTGLPMHFRELFVIITRLAVRVMSAAEKMKQLQEQSGIKDELAELAAACGTIMQSLHQYNRQAAALFGDDMQVTELLVWHAAPASTPERDIFGEQGDAREKIIRALTPIHNLFSDLLSLFNRLSGIAGYYLKNHPVLQQQYPPHLGLYIAFLRLYDYLRHQLNQLTQKHLDFYYRDILDMHTYAECADQVHILFETDLNTHELYLKAGEELVAEVPGLDDPVKYQLLQDVAITKAQVDQWRTVYISEQPIFSGNNIPAMLQNVELYSSVYTNIKQQAFLKEKELLQARPLFGEDQSGLSGDARTMDDANMGLLLASPLLYATGGKRTIRITFYCQAAGYALFNEYVDSFAKAAKKNNQAAFNEILSNAFIIHYTTPEGWTLPKKRGRLIQGTDSLELLLELDTTEQPFCRYDPLIHGDDYPLANPAIKLLVNNENAHNAYSLLRYLVVDRLHLQVEVEGFRDLKMQNSIGQLSALNPVQPFGPQPFVGSYFDIRNTNVFNRYTTAATVRMEWLELPKQPGGFKTYFAAYNAGIKNESFKIHLQSISGGGICPMRGEEQEVNLFETVRRDDAEVLSDYTVITGIDLKKLEFSNEPLLEKEDGDPQVMFNNGVLRFELTAPAEAFGHRLYPVLFPEIALHNSRRFGKKLPLPEQPYIPKVKTVTVNYTLQHAEAFKEDSATSLEWVHLYPFGYKKVHPGGHERNLLPQVDYPGNLYIGLQQLQPGSGLRLLFQLEESNFHHTVREIKPVVWSYLRDDSWITLPAGSVLADATNNFVNTGIVKLQIPADINTEHTICPAGLCWLRVSITSTDTMGVRAIAIYTQAVVAERIIDPVRPVPADFYLPAGCMKGLLHKIMGVRNTWQLFPSFNGRPAESNQHFYARISERLRHKNRPLTATDIEQFVLEKFPSISLVKCFSTTGDTQAIYPGVNILVIVIPKERADGGFDSDQPRVNLATLFAIKNYLQPFLSPFVHLEVGNPVYEKVKIAATVRFVSRSAQATADSGYYLQQLQEDIQSFFCPWLYHPGAVIKIGTRVYLSGLLAWLKNRPYIASVTGFSVVHFFREKDPITGALRSAVIDSAVEPVDFIQGSAPEAVLIPSNRHLITVLNDKEYLDPTPKGIRDFLIGDELLLSNRQHVPPATSMQRPGSTEDPDEYFDFSVHNISPGL